MPSLQDYALSEVLRLTDAGLRRSLRTLSSPQGVLVQREGRELVNFSSNDYLGLAASAEIRQALVEGVEKFGTGAGAARLVCGNIAPHEELEDALASFKRTGATLVFSSGYATAMGVIPAVVGEGDTIILDKLCHASLIDAAKLSGATIRVFPHNHLGKLQRLLAGVRKREAAAKVLVVTESIFSMDGDAAPLREIAELKDRFGAWLMVDEAHGVGVLGPQGRGLAAVLGVEDRIELQMGTLSKALGVSGGYVACSNVVRDLLVNKARSFIYSTAPPPAIAWAAKQAVAIVRGPQGDALRERLKGNRLGLEKTLQGLGCSRPALSAQPLPGPPPKLGAKVSVDGAPAIFPLIIGAEADAVRASESMLGAGFLIPAIRFPTVARGAARLRLTLGATHEAAQIESLVACLHRVVPKLFGPAEPAAEK